MMRGLVRPVLAGIVFVALSVGCGNAEPAAEPSAPAATAPPTTSTEATAEQRYPDVIAAEVRYSVQGTFRFDVTVSSPYDTPERHADAWRVVGADGTVYGVRELLHDHAGEQPFTRSLDGVAIPAGVEVVTIEARDKLNGWGGATVEVAVPGPGE